MISKRETNMRLALVATVLLPATSVTPAMAQDADEADIIVINKRSSHEYDNTTCVMKLTHLAASCSLAVCAMRSADAGKSMSGNPAGTSSYFNGRAKIF